MAVVQISRIQVRRGRKNSATSIPQLASGEMGWAVDTQELFIGNGAVSEGAPYVGNTKILTEADNIFDLVEQYQYKRNDASYITGPGTASPIQRTLQQRLDDFVSVRSFGAKGDGATDDTAAIQRAIDAIYIDYTAENVNDPDPKRRVVLNFEPGNYLVSNTIYLYPYITIRGAGKENTVIKGNGEFTVITAVRDPYRTDPLDDTSLVKYETDINQYGNLNQPRHLEVSGISFVSSANNHPVFTAAAMKNSVFKNVRFKSTFEIGTNPDDSNDMNVGLYMTAVSAAVTCQNNLFDFCDFENAAYGVDSTFDIQQNTFSNCTVSNCIQGFSLGYDVVIGVSDPSIGAGRKIGPRWTKIENTKFVDVDREGIYIGHGTGNISRSNTFIRVGNDGGNSASVVKYPIVHFEFDSNISENDYFERANDLGPALTIDFRDTAYVGEYAGNVLGEQKFFQAANITGTPESTLLKLPGNQDAIYKVKYFYVSPVANIKRQGTVTLIADLTNNRVHISDEFDVVGSLSAGENLTFTAEFYDSNGDAVKDSILLNYSSNQNGTMKYWYEVQS
jgi:hypothetical protein